MIQLMHYLESGIFDTIKIQLASQSGTAELEAVGTIANVIEWSVIRLY